MKTEKQIRNEIELQRLRDRDKANRMALVYVAMYVAILIGVLVEQFVPAANLLSGNLAIQTGRITWPQMGGALVVATLLFYWKERNGKLEGMLNNIGRLFLSGFFMGFFWNNMINRFTGG